MENKHQSWDLPQMQSLPLSAKIRMTQQRIRSWYDAWDGNVYVSISGGKDSQVLAHIVKQIYPDVPCVFVNTGLEWDCVRQKGEELSDEILRPKMNFLQVITKYGYPVISKEVSKKISEHRSKPDGYTKMRFEEGGYTKAYSMSRYKWLLDAPFRISAKCCDVMKKKPAKQLEKETGWKPFIGTMAQESRLRRSNWIRYGCNAFESKRPTSQPLSFWTEQDILLYINKYDLQIAEVYGDLLKDEQQTLVLSGQQRTGCVFCMFGISQDNEKFLKLKEIEPLKYDYVMRGGAFDESGMWIPAPDENGKMGLGYKFVIDWLNEHGNMDIRY